jgi:hypothetical protein
MKVNTFLYDGQPGFIFNPTRNFTQAQIEAGASPQLPRAIAWGYKMPYSWQSTIGFQKQLGPVMGFDADLTYLHDYNQERGRDPNLFFDPATGYNLNPQTFGRPDPRWDEIQWIESSGKAEYLLLSSSFTRRFKDNFQGGVTYTITFDRKDNTTGFGLGSDNQFDLDSQWADSTDFQRHTLRMNGIYQLPYGISLAGNYQYGSGARYSTTVSGTPFNKPGTNRLNIGAPITVPTSVLLNGETLDVRYDGPAVIGTMQTVPRNAAFGLPLHKVDLRVSKTFTLHGTVKLQGIAEVFNLLNHDNFGTYNGQVNSTTFGQPRQDLGNAYRPRTGQFAFKFMF